MTTAAVWLECPVCEYRFSVPPDYSDKSGKCPKCENVFLAGDCQLPEKALVEEQAEPPIPMPAVLAELQSESSTKKVASNQPKPPIGELSDSGEFDGDEEQTYVAVDKQKPIPTRY